MVSPYNEFGFSEIRSACHEPLSERQEEKRSGGIAYKWCRKPALLVDIVQRKEGKM